VVAFTRRVPARHGDRPGGTFRRPPTSCAHRLRKPDRTCELLALSVARWTRRCGLRPAAASTPKGGLRIMTAPSRDGMSGHLPSRQAGRCRRRFRTTTTGRTRAPSVGSTRGLAARAGSAALVVHAHSLAPHPVACCEPGPASSKADWSPRAISRSRGPQRCHQHGGAALRHEKDASHRLLQPTPVTSTLRTARFPVAPGATPAHRRFRVGCVCAPSSADSSWA
jgi:hypothetical protein